VSAAYTQAAPLVDLDALYETGEFRILHMSSSDGERKGTLELVRAFVVALGTEALPKKSELRLVLSAGAIGRVTDLIADMALPEITKQIKIAGRLGQRGASPEVMSQIYASVHVVAQPSRGEGFGMVPLEALACGAPVLATRATGHAQWFSNNLPGAIPVTTGTLGPIDDLPSAMAPRLNDAAVKYALVDSYRVWHEKKAAALGNTEQIKKQWNWPRQLAEFVRHIEGE
jgi:glycosyltransferase involved in cell wall biosynthesis